MKNKKKDEVIDLTNLPKINVVSSSLILNFKNFERRYKLLENLFKQNDKNLRFVSREQIIEFAKENKIYLDPEEGKKPNPKDPPIEKREINVEELAKAAAGILTDKSIPFMKDKKTLQEKIEELKKQKEEAIFQRDNPQPIDPKAKPKPIDKKSVVILNPDEIIIPTIDESNTDLIVVFYNYPIDIKEYLALELEKVNINHIYCLKDTDEFADEAKEEVVFDKNGKPIKAAPKETKSSNDVLQLQKYFAAPSRDSDIIYKELHNAKLQSDKHSLQRITFFEQSGFSYKINEETKKDPIVTFSEEYYTKMNIINRSYLHYLHWVSNLTSNLFQRFSPESMVKKYTPNEVMKIVNESDIKIKLFEQLNNSALLFAFCIDLINTYRLNLYINPDESNKIIFEGNEIENIFEDLEKEIIYEYGKKELLLHKSSMFESDHGSSSSVMANSHVQASKLKEAGNAEQIMINADDLSSAFKQIIDENDLILKSTIQNKIEGVSISDKEKELQIFRKIPGIARYMMPVLSPVEENKRKAMKCDIYPFLENGIGIPIYEKFLVLLKFENIFKDKIPERNFNFGDRVYQEVMSSDILSQTISHAMLYDTECLTYYNERDDNLLLGTYYRCPKGRVYRKTNKSRYLSKPDFENWIKYFRPTIAMNNDTNSINSNSKPPTPNHVNPVLPNVLPHSNEVPVSLQKKQTLLSPITKFKNLSTIGSNIPNLLDHESTMLYDGDDTCIGEVTEKIKYMFPSDDGVFIRKTIQNGIFTSTSSYVRKDNLIFGIRKNNQNVTEFWLRFENDVMLTCNYIGEFNPYVKGLESEANYDSKNGMYTTLSYKNGLNVQIMADGDICQKIYNSEEPSKLSSNELHRVITSKASVMQFLPLDKIKVMYANANVSSIQNGLAINTNNKGYRIAKRLGDNTKFEMDPIPITIQSDPESNTKTLIRDDKVINIKYPDDSELTIHSDDTKIYTFPDNLKYLIEHDDYATVQIKYDPVKKRTKTCLSDSDALLGCDNVMTRSYDGRLSEVTLPDKTVVYTYKEKKTTDEMDKYSFNTVTLIYRPDGTVIRVQQDGDICVVSSEERILMNSRGQDLNVSAGQDVDYLFELNGKPEERKRGAYTINMRISKIWTRDDEDNIFEIHADGSTKCKIKVTLDLQNSQVPIEDMRPVTPTYDTPVYIDDEAKFSDSPLNCYTPRLFVIKNDNTGYELLSEKQVSNFKIIKAKDTLHAKYFSQQIEDNFTSHYWLTKYHQVSELISETHLVNKIRIPKKLEKITQTPVTVQFPPNEIYLYRNLIESQEINAAFRDKVSISVSSKDGWFAKRKNEFGVIDRKVHMQEIEDNNKVQRRILEERQTPDMNFDYQGLQNNLGNLILEKFLEERREEMSILFDIQDYVDEKERNRIIEDMNFRILPMKNEMNGNIQEILASIVDNNPDGRSSPTKNRRKTMIDAKAMQEIKFMNDFFKSEWARHNLAGISSKGEDQSSKPKNSKKRDKIVYNNHDDLSEDENNPFGLEAVLSNMHMKSAYSNEENLNFDPSALSPIVYLENEKNEKMGITKGIHMVGNKKVLPSIYKMKIEKMKEMNEKEKKEALDWANSKNYQFHHDGRSPRGNNPLVPKYLKTTFPDAEFNEDYIYVEKLTDKRVKTSSVSKRLYFNAPSVNDIRKCGQHNFLVEALDKKKTYEEMMERLNLMITSELCDPLNKMLKIEPVLLDFGYLKVGVKYQMFLKIRNDDNMTNRVQVRKNLKSKFINVELFIGGKITPGESKKVKISFEANNDILGQFTDQIFIQTKSFVYKIPVTGILILPEDFEKLNSDRIMKYGVRLPINGEIYKKEFSEDFKKEEQKIKSFPEIFDSTAYMKYLGKSNKDTPNTSMDDQRKLPLI